MEVIERNLLVNSGVVVEYGHGEKGMNKCFIMAK